MQFHVSRKDLAIVHGTLMNSFIACIRGSWKVCKKGGGGTVNVRVQAGRLAADIVRFHGNKNSYSGNTVDRSCLQSALVS